MSRVVAQALTALAILVALTVTYAVAYLVFRGEWPPLV